MQKYIQICHLVYHLHSSDQPQDLGRQQIHEEICANSRVFAAMSFITYNTVESTRAERRDLNGFIITQILAISLSVLVLIVTMFVFVYVLFALLIAQDIIRLGYSASAVLLCTCGLFDDY